MNRTHDTLLNGIQAQYNQVISDLSTELDIVRRYVSDLEREVAYYRRLCDCAGEACGWEPTLACVLETQQAVQHQGYNISGSERLPWELPSLPLSEGSDEIRNQGWELPQQPTGSSGNPIWVDLPTSPRGRKRRRDPNGDTTDRFEQTRCPRPSATWRDHDQELESVRREETQSDVGFGQFQLDDPMESEFRDFDPFGAHGDWEDGFSQGTSTECSDDVTLGSSDEV